MSTKTLTLSAIKTAQGLRSITSTNYGYTSTEFTTGAAEYSNLTYPVTMQFQSLPSAMTPFNPTGRSVNIQLKLAAAISKSYTQVEIDVYPPTTEEAEAMVALYFRDTFGVWCYATSEKNDLENGVFSCKLADNNMVCPTPTISNLHIYTISRPYSPTGVVYCASCTATLSAGTYTVTAATLGGKPEINGIALWENNAGNWSVVSNSATISVRYNSLSLIAYADEPGVFVERTEEAVFSWHTTWTGFPIENAAQTAAALQWKNGSSGTVNSINISGSSTTYTMAANTLPESADLYWRVQTTTSDGSATSEWKSLRTVDTAAVATPISPNGSYVDGMQTSRFRWDYHTESGTLPTGYDLQVKGPTDQDFSTVKSETTANTWADIPAGTLPAGQLQWRVRAYNQSGVAGNWSDPLSCVVISAPNAPESWITDASPRPTVAWSAMGQLAYQVRVEGAYDSGTIFGTDKSFKIPVYLADGQTVVQVRVLGEYDYWSPWASATVQIENGGEGTLYLIAEAQDGDAALSWTAVANAEKYLVYRQGKLIAETEDTAYIDRYAVGTNTYRVRAMLADDDYILSNPASVTLTVSSPRLTALDGAWIVMDTYTNPLPATQITATRDVALMQYAGVDYPVAEVSPHRTRTYVCNPAFSDHAQAAAFEQLLGQPVFCKDQYGTSMLGVMSSIQRSAQRFYTVITAIIQEIGGYDI